MGNTRGSNYVAAVVTIVVILLLVGIVIALVRSARRSSDLQMCQSYLRAIGSSILLYSNENKGAYPRARAATQPSANPVWGSGVTADDPFADHGPQPNDVSAALFLLARTQDMTAEVFTCPASSAVKDTYGGENPIHRSNFSDVRKNLSYSYQNPYESGMPSRIDLKRWSSNAGLALASDINPGTSGGNDDVLAVTPNSPPAQMRRANSNNHGDRGENVLYKDGHVEFRDNPFAGRMGDNIFTARVRGKSSDPPGYLVMAPPDDLDDSILLPTDD